MSRIRFRTLLGLAISVAAADCSAPMWCQAPPADSSHKRERFRNAEITYDWVTNSQGQKIHTFVTKPKSVSGKVPAIFFVGWLSCDSVEYPDGETDGFGAIFWRLIEQSGFATMRMDKPGVGESQGACAKTDFQTELDSYRAAFESISKYPFIDQSAVFVVGLSNGGGTAPLSAGRHPVRGYIAASSWGRTWYEHMLENERVRLTMDKRLSAAEISDSMRGFTDFYALYLIHDKSPGEIIAQHPEWKTLWYDAPDGQYGRPAVFYQQLQNLNLGKAWQEVDAPVLVLHGTADTIMSPSDSRAIADIVNRAHRGHATYAEIQNADHLLAVHNKLEEHVVPTMIDWMKKQLGQR
ncbi:MAG TPA: alpha/beta hydrolase [Candidatus Acidoferrum sp.]|nr:alpha/beta hydrolase [Candidatus Acidoferrum sp.]